MAAIRDRVLILCKTYPSPSGKYAETSCVAGINAKGQFIRLFPVPFRLVRDDQQFKKWQWVSIQYQKARRDHRLESNSINIDAIVCDKAVISTENHWADRREALKDALRFTDFDQMEAHRKTHGNTLALLKPKKLLSLEIVSAKDKEWTPKELEKLLGHQQQAGLFDTQDKKDIALLKKLPYDFYYTYACEVDGEEKIYKHKIADWEAGALFWNCQKLYQDNWETPFRQKLEMEFSQKDITFLMGTIHRFPDQWLIISLIYPPKKLPEPKTMDLFA